MQVLTLEIEDNSAKLMCGIWEGGDVVGNKTEVDFNYTLQQLIYSNKYCSHWSLQLPEVDNDYIIINNKTFADSAIYVNRHEYAVEGKETLCIPSSIKLSPNFIAYCRNCGLYTMNEIEREYVRLFTLSPDVVKMAEGSMYREVV